MKTDRIAGSEDRITAAAVEASATKLIPPGSVLMVVRSGILRHSFPVATNTTTVTINQDLRALTPASGIDPAYLTKYLLRARRFVLDRCAKDGTTVNSIDVRALEQVPVPLAPFAQQRRIVERIDALFAEIEEGEWALKSAREGLETALDRFRRVAAALGGDALPPS